MCFTFLKIIFFVGRFKSRIILLKPTYHAGLRKAHFRGEWLAGQKASSGQRLGCQGWTVTDFLSVTGEFWVSQNSARSPGGNGVSQHSRTR